MNATHYVTTNTYRDLHSDPMVELTIFDLDTDEIILDESYVLPEGTDLHNDDAVEAGIREILDEQGYTEVDDDSPRGDLRVAAK
ncbi:hypothetical protein [Dermacoccus nishinomiyaensis]|uniref:hypothetical protein n=1 Tax=Dermacoccus nishinomiyaensis TaxID=1274 RepID=UPI00248E5FDA|nr:hypothetical protein [Dermacoccus nishinomiyaensis]